MTGTNDDITRDASGRFMPGRSDWALAGDAVAARFIVGRLMPAPRGRTLQIDLPTGGRMADILAAYDRTVAAMAGGEVTPDEALQVTRVLDGRLRAMKAAEREAERGNRRATSKPSPSGRGLGEGARSACHGGGTASSRRPHPDPLPQGEGTRLEERTLTEGDRHVADSTPRPPSLLHSACISRPTPPGSGGDRDGRSGRSGEHFHDVPSVPMAYIPAVR